MTGAPSSRDFSGNEIHCIQTGGATNDCLILREYLKSGSNGQNRLLNAKHEPERIE
jgi:hypothetical protein